MEPAAPALPLIVRYRDADRLRSRSVGGTVLQDRLTIPLPPQRLLGDWDRMLRQELVLEAGDVQPLPLHRARLRWPGYRLSVQALAHWLDRIGLADLLNGADQALMACRGARYHHDADRYGAFAFCNLVVWTGRPLDLHFPFLGLRIALVPGTVVIFDTGQPHAVVPRQATGFDPGDFAQGLDHTMIFLTWELALQHSGLAGRLGILQDVDPPPPAGLRSPQLVRGGRRAVLCPSTGRWL